MHDYDLERLNTRSFEQLTQALSIAVIGTQTVVFGDGPDGGREATFDGAEDYPSGDLKWNGPGIIQAKFRQEPDSSPKKNADWLITQLRAEFRKFSPKKGNRNTKRRRRICPDYYVLATNVLLSAAAHTGGKDRVLEAFEKLRRTHGLRDFAIWDGTQIRRYLDVHPNIRQTYAAWLVPGDVLSYVMDGLSLDRPDFHATIRRYLESELLDDQFARLTQGGYTEAKNIPLCSVFVDLPLEANSVAGHRMQLRRVWRSAISAVDAEILRSNDATSTPTFLSLFFETGRQVLKPSGNSREPSDHAQPGRLVLIGGPGQGKTTVGQFACQLLRAALLAAAGGPFSAEVSQV